MSKVNNIEIVCVAYRRHGELKVFVQSILNQSARNWKLNLLHDGPDHDFDSIMTAYESAAHGQINHHCTQSRHNDWGHSLRAYGLANTSAEYVLITNADNYYVPKWLEFVNAALAETDADVVYWDMVHSHDRPGGRPVPAYSHFATRFARYNIDMGAALVRGKLARQVGFRDKSHDGDATYFEDVAKAGGPRLKICKINRTLMVHN